MGPRRGELGLMTAGNPLTADEWDAKSKEHLQEAKFLQSRRRYLSVYANVGFAIECALKAAIMRKHRLNGWPADFRQRGWGTHDLNKLLKYAGLADEMRQEVDAATKVGAAWLTVKDWDNQARYGRLEDYSTGRDMLKAANNPIWGVLSWLAKK